MASVKPREPYTDGELQALYPPNLELQLVQVFLRHGERTPVSPRFQNTGLREFWPYCSVVRNLKSAVLVKDGQGKPGEARWTQSTLDWKRRLETFGEQDVPVIASGPKGELNDICDMGSLTDKGRRTTYELGERLRSLYVDRLQFLPDTLTSANSLYLRATPIPRALESMQQTFEGLYPVSTREAGPDGQFPNPVITTRASLQETLFPNDAACRRFAELSRAFAKRAADRWNNTPEMEYLNKKLGKWMPAESPRVAVDGHPRLSGIMDTINATDSHGPATKLPDEFYDPKARQFIEKIAKEEWYIFSSHSENLFFHKLTFQGTTAT
jgi:acid phosphatase